MFPYLGDILNANSYLSKSFLKSHSAIDARLGVEYVKFTKGLGFLTTLNIDIYAFISSLPEEENRLVLWEILATYGPSKVQHFYVAGGHYVVFIGRKDAVIYWWSSKILYI